MSKYSIDQVTAVTMTAIGQATAEDRNIFRQWSGMCEKQLGPHSSWVKQCLLTKSDNSFKKPDDLVKTIDIALYDSTNNEIPFVMQGSGERIHVDRFAVHDVAIQGQVTGRVDLSEDAYYYHLGNNASVVSYAAVRYFSMPVDRDGMPLVEEEDLIAHIAFCRWMWAMRRNDNRSEIDQNYAMWLTEMDRAKGRRKMVTQLQAQGIAQSWFSLINPYIKPNF